MNFTREQFLGVFAAFNHAIWPTQIVTLLLGAAVLVAILCFERCPAWTNRAVSGVLAAFWATVGVGYHGLFFASINPAAWAFAAANVFASAVVFEAGVVRGALQFGRPRGLAGAVGGIVIAYAIVGYPLISWASGRAWPYAPMFGVTPCPTTVFTLGLLLWTRRAVPRRVLMVPLAWSLIAITAAVRFSMYEDLGLAVAGAITWMLLRQRARDCAMRTRAALNSGLQAGPRHAG